MIRNIIIESMVEIAEENELKLVNLKNETVLLESGLDSLGFATLVAILEEKLGYDPFILSDDAVYPQTLKDFVEFYEKYKSYKRSING
jgi:acyl carrier protein